MSEGNGGEPRPLGECKRSRVFEVASPSELGLLLFCDGCGFARIFIREAPSAEPVRVAEGAIRSKAEAELLVKHALDHPQAKGRVRAELVGLRDAIGDLAAAFFRHGEPVKEDA